MNHYNFETLNSIDFEHLVRDLLNAELKRKGAANRFSSFPPGKDQGIDLMDSGSDAGDYNWIVQVKHQPSTPYNLFLGHLHKSTKTSTSELDKIRKLAPNRYFLATSKSLTLSNREEIMAKMSPYILSINDVYDKERLNQLLSEFPEIEVSHPKLWFSSIAVFNKIFHHDILGRSQVLRADILEKIKLYVSIYSIDNAIDILKRGRVLVLIGEPGCGKTTFAEMILYKLLSMDFTAYWINKSVNEVEKVLTNDDTKQVFYFDDFLGHTRYEIETAKMEEKGLLFFLRSIKSKTNKYFILTTRTTLLKAAAAESERFRRSEILMDYQELSISNLSERDKVRMIQNHLDVKQVPLNYSGRLTSLQLEEIARHRNFSPRIVEFVTQADNYKTATAEAYYSYILHQLNNPNEVWLHAYEQQLDKYDRFLLATLYSFDGAVREQVLEQAFDARLQFEANAHHVERPANAFYNSFRKLLGSLIVFKRYYEGERLDFVNPSLEDFFHHYFHDKPSEKLQILHGFYYVEQLYKRFRSFEQDHPMMKPRDDFKERLLYGVIDAVKSIDPEQRATYFSFYRAILNFKFFRDTQDIQMTITFLKKVNWDLLTNVIDIHLYSFLEATLGYQMLSHQILESFDEIILAYIRICQSIDNMKLAKTIFEDYSQDYTRFISNAENRSKVKEQIDFFFEDEIFDLGEDLYSNAIDIQAVYDEFDQLKEKMQDVYDEMELNEGVNLGDIEEENWEAVCARNHFKEQMIREDEARGPYRRDSDD